MSADAALSTTSSPVALVGTITLWLAYVVAAWSVAAGIAGNARKSRRLVQSAVWSLYGFAALAVLASAVIVYAFVTHDYSIKYVAQTSDTTMSTWYKVTAFWGGLDGSLLFWVLVLSVFSAVAVAMNYRKHRDMIGYVVATIMAIQVFFLSLLVFTKNPFATYLTQAPVDGQGLNPLLQNYWMIIHPPSLYTGFVAATIPFAFGVGALASGRLDDLWLGSVRVWMLVCFFFLSFGLILGGRWAYEELGWGGYWAWDPVENAGFLPWFTATAFLHTALVQEQRGSMKQWNLLLVILTFFLTIFGTFMTRSGIVQSVHAFGEDNVLALQFIVFMAVILIVSLGLLVFRSPRLTSNTSFESFLSRDFAFLLNNWVLLACAVFVLFVTMFPTLSEHFANKRISVKPEFFNEWMTPLGLALLFLAGAAPLLAWRRTTRERLYAQFLIPSALSAATMGALLVLWKPAATMTPIFHASLELPIPLLTFGLVAFVTAAVGQEFIRGVLVRAKQTGSDPMTSLIGLVIAKRRKYGGYVVHFGVGLMFLGFAGKAYDLEKDVTIELPASQLAAQNQPVTAAEFEVRGYRFRYESLEQTSDDHKVATTAHVTVWRDGEQVSKLSPARWDFRKGEQPTTEVDIYWTLSEDVYITMTGFDLEHQLSNFRIYINPLINWVWIGFVILAIGTFICLIPQALVDWVSSSGPRPSLGRAADGSIIFLVAGALLAGGATTADAASDPVLVAQAGPMEHQDDGARRRGHSDDAGHAHLNRPNSETADRLMRELICMCGGCKRENIRDCKCSYASDERARVLQMLAGYDLDTAKERAAAEEAVLAAFVKEYGGEQVLGTPRSHMSWLLPYVAIGGGLALLFVVGRSWVKRGRAELASRQGKAAEDQTYAEKLDDELRDTD